MIELRRERRDEELHVKTLMRKPKARWDKSKEKDSVSTDVTHKTVEYFLLQPEAMSARYLQPGDSVALRHNCEWITAELHGMDMCRLYQKPH